MKRLFTRVAFAGALLLAAQAQAQVIYENNFEGTSGTAIPADWSQTTLATDDGWKSGTGPGLSSQYFGIPEHTRILATNDDGCNCDKSNDVLKTPSMDFTSIAHPYVSFDLYYREGAYDDGTSVFYESLLLNVSTDGGATWTLLDTLHYTANAAGTLYEWNTVSKNLEAYSGQSDVMLAFVYNDGGSWLYGAGLDNFKVYQPQPIDAALTAVVPAQGDLSAFGMPGTSITFGGTVYNNGYEAITSLTVSYSIDGGSPVSQTLAVNIAPFTSYDFSISPAYMLALGNHSVVITTEVAGDVSTGNDQMTTSVGGAQFMPDHTVTFEEGTGTWCGWCPRGSVFMDSMYHVYGNDVVLIAVHNADPMELTAYDNGVSGMIGGYPSVLVDRKQEVDPSDLFDAYDEFENDFGFANITTTDSYNAATRQLTVTANANFAVELVGDYRLALVLTEDAVRGTTSAYDQVNYYSFQSQNVPLIGAGHNWQTEPAEVPAASMHYDFVARYISGGFTGQANSLPDSIPAGSTQTYTFSTTLPSAWQDWRMKSHVLLIDATNNRILNAVNVSGMINGTDDIASQIDRISLYPNPSEGALTVLFSLQTQKDVTIEITDVLGKVVGTYNYNNVAAGTNNVTLNVANLSGGVYFANVKTDSGMVSRKFIKE